MFNPLKVARKLWTLLRSVKDQEKEISQSTAMSNKKLSHLSVSTTLSAPTNHLHLDSLVDLFSPNPFGVIRS